MEEIELRALTEKLANEYARCAAAAWSDLTGRTVSVQVGPVNVFDRLEAIEDRLPAVGARVGYGRLDGEDMYFLFNADGAEMLAQVMFVGEGEGSSMEPAQVLSEGIQCALFPFSNSISGLLSVKPEAVVLKEVKEIESPDELAERLRGKRSAVAVLDWSVEDTVGSFALLFPEPPAASSKRPDSAAVDRTRLVDGHHDNGDPTGARDVTAPKGIHLGFISDVPLFVTVELGHVTKTLADVLSLGPGSVIELDKLAGEPVDVLVNGRLIARGEVVVIDENFGVRVTEISRTAERVQGSTDE